MLNISFKGELDEIDPQIKNTFDIFTEFINEEGLKKIFSKNILYKEEGIDLFIKKMDDIFSKDHHENIDSYINQIFKNTSLKNNSLSFLAFNASNYINNYNYTIKDVKIKYFGGKCYSNKYDGLIVIGLTLMMA